ncbi:sporulation protein [Paenibacillus doosanensis]|uniref:nucleoside recognition domain-containing protein n=1 Tax=Paenibacillus doosanensis TaxID=1229154 RepID=UPI00217F820D|nr:nucleoside recognition domain-containing protein [Paenibacillus doosanensis]MCS7459490.1 sporulation protein [Paenibacillus doosanensis]
MAGLKMLSSQRMTTLTLGCLALLLVVCIILFPDRAFQSSLQGLTIWWKLVFPALLPFFIVTEIVRGMGILHALGALFDPLLRLLFRLPGIGGWAIAVGCTSGTPSGAVAVGTLRRDRLVSRDEAERLLALSHVMSPVFLITVVGVGFLHNAQSGLALALLHYGSALLVGVWQRISHSRHPLAADIAEKRAELQRASTATNLFSRSAYAFHVAKAKDGRTFGKLLGDSVTHSVQQLMAVGGLMMMFSVLVHALSMSEVLSFIGLAFSAAGFGTPQEVNSVIAALLPGLFEPHLGAYAVGQAEVFPGSWPYALLSALLAWGGLSTHAQMKSFTLGTDIRYTAFLKSRLLHAAFSFIATAAFWRPLNGLLSSGIPVWLPGSAPAPLSVQEWNLWPLLTPAFFWFSGILLLMLLLSVFAAFALRHNRRGSSL